MGQLLSMTGYGSAVGMVEGLETTVELRTIDVSALYGEDYEISDPRYKTEVFAIDGTLMEQYAEGLPYKGEDNVQFGTSWNKNKNYSAGLSCRNWAMLNLQGLHLCRCFEIPFANARGTEVNPESARAFGRSIAKTLVEWFPTIQ